MKISISELGAKVGYDLVIQLAAGAIPPIILLILKSKIKMEIINYIVVLFSLILLITGLYKLFKRIKLNKQLSIRFEAHKFTYKGDFLEMLTKSFRPNEIKRLNELNILTDKDFSFFQLIHPAIK